MDKKELDKAQESNTIVYTVDWNPTKSARLKRIRGASFEELFWGDLIDIRQNLSRGSQQLLIFYYNGYVWAVPFVVEGQGIFLKTLYRCRKYNKLFRKR